MRPFHIFLLSLLIAGRCAIAQETPADKDDPELVKLRKVLDQSIDLFQMSYSRDRKISMTPKSVQRWTNNEREAQSVGELVLWLDRGQPVAAMGTYNWAGKFYHEFEQISRDAVVVRYAGNDVWEPKEGLTFLPIPDAPAVEGNPAARLRQIKTLAEQFHVTMMGWRTDRSDRAELRRLPRELYRYQPEKAPVIDGAVFAFVMGTDPEALLMIEAVQGKDQSEWQYAFVRQTSASLQARHLDQVVWQVNQNGARRDPTALSMSLFSPLNLRSREGE